MEGLSTLCYIEDKGRYLMLHRTVKERDVNKDKWIGVGGHFEPGESPGIISPPTVSAALSLFCPGTGSRSICIYVPRTDLRVIP